MKRHDGSLIALFDVDVAMTNMLGEPCVLQVREGELLPANSVLVAQFPGTFRLATEAEIDLRWRQRAGPGG